VSPTGWHTLSVGPIPVAFHLYVRPHFGDVEDAGDASSWVRVRTWLGPLTNASDALGTEDNGGRTVALGRTRSGEYMVQDEFYGETPAELGNDNPLAARYVAARLGFGVTSSAGLAYWMALGAVLAVHVAWRFPLRARRP